MLVNVWTALVTGHREKGEIYGQHRRTRTVASQRLGRGRDQSIEEATQRLQDKNETADPYRTSTSRVCTLACNFWQAYRAHRLRGCGCAQVAKPVNKPGVAACWMNDVWIPASQCAMWPRRFCSRTRCKNSKVLCYTYYIFNGQRSVVGYRPPKKQSECVVTSYLSANANLLSFSPCLKLRVLNSHWLWLCVVIVGQGKPL